MHDNKRKVSIGEMLRAAAEGRFHGGLDGLNIEKRRKVPEHIFSDAKVAGKEAEIEYLQETISQLLDKTEEQQEQIKADAETIEMLQSEKKELERQSDGLAESNSVLSKKNAQLIIGMKKQSERTIARRKAIIRLVSVKIAIGNVINNLEKKPTKKNFQDTILAIQNILDVDAKISAEATVADEATTANAG